MVPAGAEQFEVKKERVIRRDAPCLFCRSCVRGGAGRGKIIWQPGEQTTGGSGEGKKLERACGGCEKHRFQADLEILLTQQNRCACSVGLLRGPLDKHLSEVPFAASAGWVFPVLGVNNAKALEPGEEEAMITSACQICSCRHRTGRFKQAWGWEQCTYRLAGHPSFGGHLKRSHNPFIPPPPTERRLWGNIRALPPQLSGELSLSGTLSCCRQRLEHGDKSGILRTALILPVCSASSADTVPCLPPASPHREVTCTSISLQSLWWLCFSRERGASSALGVFNCRDSVYWVCIAVRNKWAVLQN